MRAGTSYEDSTSSIAASSDQYLTKNNMKLKKDFATFKEKNKKDKVTIKDLYNRIKALESVVEK